MQTIARRLVLKLRDQPRLAPARPGMTHLLRELDQRLPESARPRKTSSLCYRLVNGRSCNLPLYIWPDGRRFCYEHPEER